MLYYLEESMKSRYLNLFLTLFLFVSIFTNFSSNGKCDLEENGNVLFVGGSGIGNYRSIQDAINDSVSGNTIIVYEDIYYENLVLNKSVILIGVDKYNTSINGNGIGDVVVVSADNACISNFTIKNSGSSNAGIVIQANNCFIEENIIVNNGWCGIKTGDVCKNCTISKNIIKNNGYGIFFKDITFKINIYENIISDNTWDGIYIDYSNDDVIIGNIIEDNGDDGISLSFCRNITISNNTIEKSGDNGLYLYSSKTTINQNTFMYNVESGIFLRNSNFSNISWNIIWNNKNGVDVTYLSTGNKVVYNNITKNSIGIYVPIDAGFNSYSDNVFSDNSEDFVQDESPTPGFEIIFMVFSVILILNWKYYKNR